MATVPHALRPPLPSSSSRPVSATTTRGTSARASPRYRPGYARSTTSTPKQARPASAPAPSSTRHSEDDVIGLDAWIATRASAVRTLCEEFEGEDGATGTLTTAQLAIVLRTMLPSRPTDELHDFIDSTSRHHASRHHTTHATNDNDDDGNSNRIVYAKWIRALVADVRASEQQKSCRPPGDFSCSNTLVHTDMRTHTRAHAHERTHTHAHTCTHAHTARQDQQKRCATLTSFFSCSFNFAFPCSQSLAS